MSETVTAPAGKKRNVFARIARFFREVVDELRKVAWPCGCWQKAFAQTSS